MLRDEGFDVVLKETPKCCGCMLEVEGQAECADSFHLNLKHLPNNWVIFKDLF